MRRSSWAARWAAISSGLGVGGIGGANGEVGRAGDENGILLYAHVVEEGIVRGIEACIGIPHPYFGDGAAGGLWLVGTGTQGQRITTGLKKQGRRDELVKRV